MIRNLILLLCISLLTACNWQSGPKNVLIFQAAAWPGAKDVELERTKALVERRLLGAKLKCRFRVETSGPDQIVVTTFGAKQAELDKINEFVTTNGSLEFAPIASPRADEAVIAAAKDAEREVQLEGVVRGAWVPATSRAGETFEYLREPGTFRDRTVDGKERRELLVVYDPELRLTGDLVEDAFPTTDSTGRPAVGFKLSPEGGDRMYILTNELKPSSSGSTRQLGIIWNGELETAPTVQSPISDRGVITGNFSVEEAQLKAVLLRSGQLPCQLTFVKETSGAAPPK